MEDNSFAEVTDIISNWSPAEHFYLLYYYQYVNTVCI